jgi:hypothetical protein
MGLQIDDVIMVSGPARSGTTFMQNLLSSHSQIKVYGQETIPIDEFLDFYDKIECGSKIAQKNNLNFEGNDLIPHYAGGYPPEARVLFARFWRDFFSGGQPIRRYWGFKALWLSEDQKRVDRFQRIFKNTKWVICIRNPFQSYASHCRNYSVMDLEESLRRWRNTIDVAFKNNNMLIWVTDDKENLTDYRLKKIDRLCFFLQINQDNSMKEFVNQWPVIHKQESYKIEEYINKKHLEKICDKLPRIREYLKEFKYSL